MNLFSDIGCGLQFSAQADVAGFSSSEEQPSSLERKIRY